MKILPLYLLILFAMLTVNLSSQTIKCHLKGEVIDRTESTTLILTKIMGDSRVKKIEIPIVDNHFDYLLECCYEELYELAFEDEINRGSWMTVEFISENSEIKFKLYPTDKYDDNSITGGRLNAEQINRKLLKDSLFQGQLVADEIALLDKTNKLYSPKVYPLMDLFNTVDNTAKDSIRTIIEQYQNENKYYSEKGYKLMNRQSELYKERMKWEQDYALENNTLLSFFELYKKITLAYNILKHSDKPVAIMFPFIKIDPLYDVFNKNYKSKFSDHPYAVEIENLYKAYVKIKVGGQYIDFENPSFEGKNVKLSEEIKGKIALVNLWASWCGPCRRHSKEIIPLYEAYKDRGFVVVGVAREEKAEYAINAAKQDGYPWLNLLEIGDQNQIWHKYGIGNSGGATFLVDKDGTILAIDVSAEKLNQILEEKLN